MSESNGTPPAAAGPAEGAPAALTDAEKTLINTRWRDAVSPEYGTHASTASIKTLDDLSKSFVNAQKLVGAEKLPKPTKKWKKAEWESFNKQIGMPEKAEDYDLKDAKLPKDYKINGEDEKWFRGIAREELNLSNFQAKQLWEKLHGRNAEKTTKAKEDYTTSVQEGYTKLKEEWGPNYENIVKQTSESIKRLDDDGRFMEFMKKKGLNNEPEMLRFAAKVAKLTSEDKISPNDEKSTNLLSSSEAQSQVKKLMSEAMKDPKHPLMNKKDPQHDAEVKKLARLSDIAKNKGGKK